jgi:hypothetical protein
MMNDTYDLPYSISIELPFRRLSDWLKSLDFV